VRRKTIASLLALTSGTVVLLSGCGLPDSTDLGCKQSTCHMVLKSGESIKIGSLSFSVEHVDADYVTLSSHDFSLRLNKNMNIAFSGYHFHLNGSSGGSASVDVSH
jgi:hypothetical protein